MDEYNIYNSKRFVALVNGVLSIASEIYNIIKHFLPQGNLGVHNEFKLALLAC